MVTTPRMPKSLIAGRSSARLIYTCLIGTRAQEVDEDDDPVFDAYQVPVMGDYAPTLAPPVTATGGRVACFAWQPRPGGRDGEVATGDTAYVGHRWLVRVPLGTGLAEDHAIADIRDRDGALILAGPLNVKEAVPRRGYTLARCDLAATGLGAA